MAVQTGTANGAQENWGMISVLCFGHRCSFKDVCICFMPDQSLSCVWLFVAPWTVAHQAPLSMEFSRQEYWSGLPFPTPRDPPNQGIEPASPVFPALAGTFFFWGGGAGRFFTTVSPVYPLNLIKLFPNKWMWFITYKIYLNKVITSIKAYLNKSTSWKLKYGGDMARGMDETELVMDFWLGGGDAYT